MRHRPAGLSGTRARECGKDWWSRAGWSSGGGGARSLGRLGRSLRDDSPLLGVRVMRPVPVGLDADVPTRQPGDGRHDRWIPCRPLHGPVLHGDRDAGGTELPCRGGHKLRHRHRLGGSWGLNRTGDDTIAIFGQGPVGLAATQLAGAIGGTRDRSGYLVGSTRAVRRARSLGDSGPEQCRIGERRRVRDLTGGRGVAKSLNLGSVFCGAKRTAGPRLVGGGVLRRRWIDPSFRPGRAS